MMAYAEAMLLLLPAEAGGRIAPVEPREGSYRPFVRSSGEAFHVRIIEGPPLLLPGENARVVVEIDAQLPLLDSASEWCLYERDERVVGALTLLRILREAIPA
jgi:hypothetical protein